jgi:hypothetical protein
MSQLSFYLGNFGYDYLPESKSKEIHKFYGEQAERRRLQRPFAERLI